MLGFPEELISNSGDLRYGRDCTVHEAFVGSSGCEINLRGDPATKVGNEDLRGNIIERFYSKESFAATDKQSVSGGIILHGLAWASQCVQLHKIQYDG